MKTINWVVIVSRVGAHFYNLDHRGNLKLVADFANPLGREKNRAFTTDKPGLGRGKFKGSAPHALSGEKDPHEDITDQFARQVSGYLRKYFMQKYFTTAKVVAEPKLLGKIKGYSERFLDDHIQWVTKDLDNIPKIKWPSLLGFKRIPDKGTYIHSNRTQTS